MADLPYPLQSTSIDELRVQMLDMFRDLYEVRIGGSLIGDVFEVSGDVLQIKLKTGSGLKKTNGELDFDMSTVSAPASAVLRSNYTAKGAIISASAASTIGVFTVGTDGQVIKADSTQPLGLAWTTPHTQGTDTTVGVQTDDVVINDATKGIVLKDTQATPHYWRITVNNSGTLVVSDVGTSIP